MNFSVNRSAIPATGNQQAVTPSHKARFAILLITNFDSSRTQILV
jgi:hypothetical protein